MSRRITVRQLESLVRLSEALARLHCSETVEKAHVEEAVKLARDCNKPVVRPDIDLADDDFNEDFNVPAQNEEDVLRDVSNVSNESVKRAEREPEAENIDPERLKITYDFYKRISNLLVLRLRGEQDLHVDDPEWSGIKCSELADWYLDSVEDDLATVEDYNIQKIIIKRLIRKLLKDSVLINLDDADSQDPIVVAHPDHVVEEDINAD